MADDMDQLLALYGAKRKDGGPVPPPIPLSTDQSTFYDSRTRRVLNAEGFIETYNRREAIRSQNTGNNFVDSMTFGILGDEGPVHIKGGFPPEQLARMNAEYRQAWENEQKRFNYPGAWEDVATGQLAGLLISPVGKLKAAYLTGKLGLGAAMKLAISSGAASKAYAEVLAERKLLADATKAAEKAVGRPSRFATRAEYDAEVAIVRDRLLAAERASPGAPATPPPGYGRRRLASRLSGWAGTGGNWALRGVPFGKGTANSFAKAADPTNPLRVRALHSAVGTVRAVPTILFSPVAAVTLPVHAASSLIGYTGGGLVTSMTFAASVAAASYVGLSYAAGHPEIVTPQGSLYASLGAQAMRKGAVEGIDYAFGESGKVITGLMGGLTDAHQTLIDQGTFGEAARLARGRVPEHVEPPATGATGAGKGSPPGTRFDDLTVGRPQNDLLVRALKQNSPRNVTTTLIQVQNGKGDFDSATGSVAALAGKDKERIMYVDLHNFSRAAEGNYQFEADGKPLPEGSIEHIVNGIYRMKDPGNIKEITAYRPNLKEPDNKNLRELAFDVKLNSELQNRQSYYDYYEKGETPKEAKPAGAAKEAKKPPAPPVDLLR